MKKLMFLLAVFVLLTGCAGGGTGENGVLNDVAMALEVQDDNIHWTITNHGKYSYSHGNEGFAALQVQTEDGWNYVSDESKAITAEGHWLAPGNNYSGTLDLEEYGDLADGTYRVVFRLYNDLKDHEAAGFAACPFQIADGAPQTE